MNSQPVVIVSAARTPIGKSFKILGGKKWNAWQLEWDLTIAFLFTLIQQELCLYANSELNVFITVVAALILPVCLFVEGF